MGRLRLCFKGELRNIILNENSLQTMTGLKTKQQSLRGGQGCPGLGERSLEELHVAALPAPLQPPCIAPSPSLHPSIPIPPSLHPHEGCTKEPRSPRMAGAAPALGTALPGAAVGAAQPGTPLAKPCSPCLACCWGATKGSPWPAPLCRASLALRISNNCIFFISFKHCIYFRCPRLEQEGSVTEGCCAGAGPQTLPPAQKPSPKKENPTTAVGLGAGGPVLGQAGPQLPLGRGNSLVKCKENPIAPRQV